MGSRGSLGGLSRASYDAVKVLDAAGMDYIIIETVGVGQSEVDIIKLADIVILVLIPGMGDDIQAIKAGIMEIADIFVVNKSDLDGTDRLVTEIQMNLDLNPDKSKSKPPIVKTVALTGEGIDELKNTIFHTQKQFQEQGLLNKKRKKRINQELRELIREIHLSQIASSFETKIDDFTEKIFNKEVDPISAAVAILQNSKDNIKP